MEKSDIFMFIIGLLPGKSVSIKSSSKSIKIQYSKISYQLKDVKHEFYLIRATGDFFNNLEIDIVDHENDNFQLSFNVNHIQGIYNYSIPKIKNNNNWWKKYKELDIKFLRLEQTFKLYLNNILSQQDKKLSNFLLVSLVNNTLHELKNNEEQYFFSLYSKLFYWAFQTDQIQFFFEVFSPKNISLVQQKFQNPSKEIHLFMKQKAGDINSLIQLNELETKDIKEKMVSFFFLYFIFTNEFDKINELVNKNIEIILPFLKKYYLYIPPLCIKTLEPIFEFLESYDDLKKILYLTESVSDCIKLLLQKEKEIRSWNFKLQDFNIGEKKENKEIYNLNEFKKLLENFSEKRDKYDQISHFGLSYQYFIQNKSFNSEYNFLMEISHLNIFINKSGLNDFYKNLVLVGLKACSNHKFSNIEVLNFIEETPNFSKYTKIEEAAFGIDSEAINDVFTEKFQTLHFKKFYTLESEQQKFYRYLLESVKSFQGLRKVFLLFTKQNIDFHKPNFLIESITQTFRKLIYNDNRFNREDTMKIKEFVISFIQKFDLYEKYSKYFELNVLNPIKNCLPKENAIKIFIECFHLLDNSKKLIKENILSFLREESKATSSTEFIHMIGKNKANVLFEIFAANYFSKNDFFLPEISKNLLLTELFIKEGFFENEYKNAFYIKRTNEKINEFLNVLEKEEYSIHEIEQINLLSLDTLKRRATILYKGDKIKGDALATKIKDKSTNIVDIREKISVVQIFENFFFESTSTLIPKIIEFNNNIASEEVKNIYSKYQTTFNEVTKKYKTALEDTKLIQSSFFKALYEELQFADYEQEENNRVNAKAQFNTLMNLLDKTTIREIDKNILNIILKKATSEQIIRKEFIFLKDHFGKTNQKYLNINTNENEETLYYLGQLSQIENQIKNILKFLQEMNVTKTEYYEELEKHLKNIKEIDQLEIDNAKKIFDALKKFDIDPKVKDYCFIIGVLCKNDQLIPFLKDKTEAEIRNLVEFIDEVDDAFIKPTEVTDLTKLVIFFNTLTKKSVKNDKPITDKEFMREFKLLIKEHNNQDIGVYIENVSKNLIGIRELYSRTINKQEFSQQKIQEIYKLSTFNISNNNNDGIVNCICSYQKKKIGFEELVEMKNRALLKKGNNEKAYQKIVQFSEIISQLEVLIGLIDELFQKGYPSSFEISFQIIECQLIFEKEIFGVNNLIDLNWVLKTKIEELNLLQATFYKEHELMTYLSGRQFGYFNKAIKNKETNEKYLEHFLNFLTHGNYTKKITNFEYKSYNDGENEEINNMLYNINEFINNVFKENRITIEDIFRNSLIQDEKYKGNLYVVVSKENNLEIELISLYNFITGNNPTNHTILFCNSATTIEEIRAFLYRVVLCSQPVLFMIAKENQLEMDKKHFLIQTLEYLLREHKMISSLVIYVESYSGIREELRKIPYFKNLLSEGIKLIDKLEHKNIEIISSDASGIGKSAYIFNKSKTSNKKYVYFPIGGVFTRLDLIERLQKLELQNENCILHLDLVETKEINLLKDFLFCFLILGYYSQDEKIFSLIKNIEICVELPCGFINYLEIFPILKIFKLHSISSNSKPPLEVDNSITSNMQIVCNYLKYRRQNLIRQKDVYIEGITMLGKSHYHVNTNVLSQKECSEIINQYFRVNNPTYYQLHTFLNVLGDQFKYMSNNIYLTIDILLNNGQAKGQGNLPSVRNFLVDSLVKITEHFTKGSYTNIINSQDKTYEVQIGTKTQDEIEKDMVNFLINKEPISFDQINPSLVFFNEDIMSLTFIATCAENTQEYKDLTNLLNSQGLQNNLKLKKYKTLDQENFLLEVKKILDLKHDLKKSTLYRRSLKEIAGPYVFTADNFIKMVLIILRIRANIPIIMMGETGCGKTSLIRMLSELKEIELKILNIHAGITNKEIVEFVEREQLLAKQRINYNSNEKIWVFLDEINTCDSMGLISEMLCKHTIQGEKLYNKVVFIAACNPYRIITKKQEIVGLVNTERHKVRNLVYSVNPLPHSLLNYVFDFGNLTKEDEERYISSMIHEPIYETFPNDDSKAENVKKFAKDIIIYSQNFIRDKNDISSVSLREVRRFVVLYKWFFGYLDKRSSFMTYLLKSILKLYDNGTYSVILSAILCYYLRLSNKEDRLKYINGLTENNIIKGRTFLKIYRQEMEYIADQITLPPGIAKNKALLENLFTLFVCINNYIPVFICGKPGCSKTLSFQLLFNAMKGETSNNALFKQYPLLIVNSYQGSLTSNSKGVLKIFEKARNIVRENNKAEKKENIISLIFFDEIGLAEISKNNPLKVIHSQLEYDENKDKVAFVGISNWTLDASKMNRGIFLSIPDQDMNDLKETAEIIASSYDENLGKTQKDFWTALSETYYNYKKFLDKNHPDKKEFHGSRDFYHLIKYAAQKLIEKKNKPSKIEISSVGIISLEKNFGGLSYSLKEIKEIFKQKYQGCNNLLAINEYDVMNCIKRNIQDITSRYLLVISKSSISPFLISSILGELGKTFMFYIGSQFDEDINEEFYSVKIINKIQACMEAGTITVLKNLESIYPSLYDLFNQNFTVVADKKYSRIALGSSNNVWSMVHDNFRCIILLDEEEINKQDPPFLNRFEKHIISFEYLLQREYSERAKTIYDNLEKLIKPKDTNNKNIINLKNQMVNCDLEEIKGIVYNLKCKNTELKDLEHLVLEKIVPSFSQDIIAFAYRSELDLENPSLVKKIIDIYSRDKMYSIKNLLARTTNSKNIVYTFSSILQSIFLNKENINNEKFGEIKRDSLKEIILSRIQMENEIEKEVEEFYKKDQFKVLIVRFEPNDCIHLNHINFFVESFEKENVIQNSKIVIMIIHFHRHIIGKDYTLINSSIKHKDLISHLSTYNQLFIDNLNGEEFNMKELLELNSEQIFENKSLIDIEKVNDEVLYESFTTCLFEPKNVHGNLNADNYMDKIVESLCANNKIKEQIRKFLFGKVEKSVNIFDSIFFSNVSLFEQNDVDFYNIIKKYLRDKFSELYTKFIVNSERHGVFYPLIYGNLKNFEEEQEYMFNNYLEKFDMNSIRINHQIKGNKIPIVFGLNIINSVKMIDTICHYADSVKDSVLFAENEIRWIDDNDEDVEENKNENMIIINSVNNNVYNEIIKQPILNYLKEQYEKKGDTLLIESIYDDFYKIFLSKKLNCDYESIKLDKFIELFVNIRFSDENKDLKYLGKIITWLLANENTIFLIIGIYQNLCKYIPNLYDLIKTRINNGEIKQEISQRNPENKRMMNKPFYFVLSSLIQGIIEFLTISDINNNEEKVFDFFRMFKSSVQTIKKIDSDFKLYLKSLFLIINLISICECATRVGDNKEFVKIMKEFIAILERENNYINDNAEKNDENYTQNIIAVIKDGFNFYSKYFSQLGESFYDLITNYLFSEYKVYKNNDIRKFLVEYLVNNPNSNALFVRSINLINLIFISFTIVPEVPDNLDDIPEDFYDSFLEISKVIDGPIDMLDILDKANNPVLDEMLLYFFETSMSKYFSQFCETHGNDKRQLLHGCSLEYLKLSIKFLDDMYKKEVNDEITFPHLGFLYAVSYIKIYLSNFIKINHFNKDEIGDTNTINEVIYNGYDNEFRKVLQIYILKILRSILNTYQELETYDWERFQIPWGRKHNLKDVSKSPFDYFFMDIDKLDKYTEINKKVNAHRNSYFDSGYHVEIVPMINNAESFDIFVNIMINILFANLIKPNYIGSKDYTSCEEYFKMLIKNKEFTIPVISKDLLGLIGIKQNFITKLRTDIQNLNQNTYEILMYCYKLAIMSSLSNPNSFYSQCLSPNMVNTINNSYIPGGEPKDDMIIESSYNLAAYLETYNNISEAAYLCSCGYWYAVKPCGFPMEISQCPYCYQNIGGTNHVMVMREGHVRILLDHHFDQCNQYPLVKMKLSDLKKKIEAIIADEPKGVKQVNKIFFIKNKKVRNLEPISYRLLSLLFYSNLYFGYLLGYINLEMVNKYSCTNITILEMLQICWEALQNELNNKGIAKIQVFLNMVLPKIADLIHSCPQMDSIEKRRNFENIINAIINEQVNGYGVFSTRFATENNRQMQVDITSYKSIIHETENPNEYNKNEFPFLKYFMLSQVPNVDYIRNSLEQVENYQQKYPILYNYFNQSENVLYLEKLGDINPFANYMLGRKSYSISREKAKTIKFKDELNEINDEKVQKMFNVYRESWNKVSKKARKYGCRNEMEEKTITENDCIAYCLNDDGELYYGMRLASYYSNCIVWQNAFLQSAVVNISQDSSLYYFKEEINKKIGVQQATKLETVSFEINNDNSPYSNIQDIITIFTKRNCFNPDYSINYQNYKTLVTDFKQMDEEMGNIFLPGKRIFKEELEFVVYDFEAYSGSKSNVIQNFEDKYPQRPLTDNEKEILYDFKERNDRYSLIMFSLQLLIFHLHKQNENKLAKLKDIIPQLPNKFPMNPELSEFFLRNDFTLETLLEVFEFLEYLSKDEVLLNVNPDYQKKINDDMILQINRHFDKDKELFVKRIHFASAVRKFISRFLSGTRAVVEFSGEKELIIYLQNKPDLWCKSIREDKENKFDEEMEMLQNIGLKVEHSVHLYNVLGSDGTLYEKEHKRNVPIIQQNLIKDSSKQNKLAGEKGTSKQTKRVKKKNKYD